FIVFYFFFQAEDGIRDFHVTGVQTCALPICYFNFDAHTGGSLEHKDLFTQDFLSYAEKAFREQYDIPQEESINSTGLWFEEDKFSLPINIGIDKEHVILVYNSYEVASYAEGEFKLE